MNSLARNFLTAAAFAALGVTTAHAAGTPSNRGVGVNLGVFDYYTPDMPTIDQFKRGAGWFTQCTYKDSSCNNFGPGQSGWDTQEQSKMKVDENGWPTSLPAANDTSVKYRSVSVLMFKDDSRVHPAGKYTVLYDGEGTIEYTLGGTKVAGESKPNRDVVDVVNNTDAGLLLTITKTNPNNYVRNIRVLPPGGVCNDDRTVFAQSDAECAGKGLGSLVKFENLQGRTWHPSFVADLKGFRTLRFLDWNRTNSSMLANWEDRPRWNDHVWTGPAGVPVNAMVSLANEVGADPWINLPTHATDDYALRFARQLKSILGPKLKLILEYTNEAWNPGFPQTLWIRDQAYAAWKDVHKGVDPWTLQPSWYAMRAAQLCKIVKAEFGADASRVQCVSNTQAGFIWLNQQFLDCPYAMKEMGGVPCYKSMDAVAIAPYFGDYIKQAAFRGEIKKWYSQPDGGVGKLFEEILGQDASGNKVTPPLYQAFPKSTEVHSGGAVAKAKSWMQNTYNEAKARGIPMWAYEGGQHLILGPGDSDQKYLDMITAANRDGRMSAAYTRTLSDWQATGGQVYTVFNHVFRPSQYGSWGLKETQFQKTSAPKWNAVLSYRDSKNCWWLDCVR